MKVEYNTKNSSFTSYEINLILKDWSRINVIDHWNKNAILEDAKILWDFLRVRVWDNIS